ncbi:VOC family protein [Cyanobium sp. LEGE 06113]|uniref:VOC family protein n=1 Tax=Cyanobium sp. LEGE 06113 TaxID=1297573 RepID=UPI00351C5B6F
MAETVGFYTEVLGMPLFKTVELPDGGQHFFFDCGGGNAVAFFWWADAPPAAPGIASVKKFPFDAKTAVGSMNHLASTWRRLNWKPRWSVCRTQACRTPTWCSTTTTAHRAMRARCTKGCSCPRLPLWRPPQRPPFR